MSNPSDNSKPLRENLEEWLAREGYPLELSVANVFRSAGFQVRHRQPARSEDPEQAGGGDVTAWVSSQAGESVLRLYHLVECKWSKDKPWVIFLGDTRVDPVTLAAQTIASQTARALFWARAGDPAVQGVSLFTPPAQFGFSGRQAFEDKSDVVDRTVHSVLARALRLATSHDAPNGRLKDLLQTAVAVFPTIVVDGPLYTASLGAEADKFALNPASHVRIHSRASAVWPLHAAVDVVTVSDLPQFAAQRRQDTQALIQQLTEPLKQLQRCWRERSLAPLEVTAGPKGSIGLPHLLREMRARFPAGAQFPPTSAAAPDQEDSPALPGFGKLFWKARTNRPEGNSRATLE